MGHISTILSNLKSHFVELSIDPESKKYFITLMFNTSFIIKTDESFKLDKIVLNDKTNIYKIFPKTEKQTVDDLFDYALLLVNLNYEIINKKEEFEKELEKMTTAIEQKKRDFEKSINEFVTSLDQKKISEQDEIKTKKK
jgi:hypothetical protein